MKTTEKPTLDLTAEELMSHDLITIPSNWHVKKRPPGPGDSLGR